MPVSVLTTDRPSLVPERHKTTGRHKWSEMWSYI